MKKKKNKILILLFGVILIISTSCKKIEDPDSQSAEDDTVLASGIQDVFSIGNDIAVNAGVKNLFDYSECVTVKRTVLEASTVDTVVFNDCIIREITRNGTIIITYTKENPQFPNRISTMSITFDNYSADDIGVEGTISSSIGAVSLTPTYTIIATDMVFTYSGDRTITGNSEKTFTMIEGFGDLDPTNNVLEVSGTAGGTNREGNNFASQANKIRREWACKYPVSGTTTITGDKGETIVNFGEGTCDNEATVTKKDVTSTIKL